MSTIWKHNDYDLLSVSEEFIHDFYKELGCIFSAMYGSIDHFRFNWDFIPFDELKTIYIPYQKIQRPTIIGLL